MCIAFQKKDSGEVLKSEISALIWIEKTITYSLEP